MDVKTIDVYLSSDHVILSRGQSSVWCCKKSGELLLNAEFDPIIQSPQIGAISHLGKVCGLVGKLRYFTDGEWKLLLITQAHSVGALPQGGTIYCVEKIAVLPLTADSTAEIIGLDVPEARYDVASGLSVSLTTFAMEMSPMVAQTATVRPPSPPLKKIFNFIDTEKSKELRDREKLEKRLTEALLGMFNDSKSFYFSTDFDFTHSLQTKTETPVDEQLPLWKMVDERFFWNKWMLGDLIDNYQGPITDPWILPLIQGFVEIRQIPIVTQHSLEILQPGWTARYAERRRSLIAEVDTPVELNVSLDDNIVQKLGVIDDEIGSGYETDSESEEENLISLLDHTPSEIVCEEPKEQFTQLETKIEEAPSENEPTLPPNEASSNNLTIIVDGQAAVQGSPVPSLQSLCKRLVEEQLQVQDKLHVQNSLRPSSNLSGFDSDHFTNRGSAELEDWVAVPPEDSQELEPPPSFTLAIVSRRSSHRAGTRYRRRGVDESGNVANYVETEMISQCGSHLMSYVIVRGSVPVYWTQPGYKYRPLPVIEGTEESTQEAFRKHFDEQLRLYKELVAINLVKQTGKEKILADEYEKHILLLNDPKVTYVVFDFHQQYKTNPSDALQKLLAETSQIARNMRFCWLDLEQEGGVLCQQESVFRVNCMDCLDRTNVTQSVFSREVLQSALHKLGVIPFEEKLDGPMLTSFKEMWANNGDVLSKQYAGTVAMKGDITRYGERKITGMMKDGYNSAARYYLNIFRDSYRQVVIDLMQGVNPSEAFSSLPSSLQGTDELEEPHQEAPPTEQVALFSHEDKEHSPEGLLDREEAVTDIVQHCKIEVFPDKRLHLQTWALVEAAGHSFVSASHQEELCVLVQCRETEQLVFVSYSLEVEQIVALLRIPMKGIQQIVIGPLGVVLRSSRRQHMRIYYTLAEEDTECYLTFRTVNTRPLERDRGYLLGIAEALSYLEPNIKVTEHKLTKKKSPEHQGVVYLVVPPSFVQTLDRELSHDSHMEDNHDSGSDQATMEEKPLSARCHSVDDILSSTGEVVPAVTVSQAAGEPASPTSSGMSHFSSDSNVREQLEEDTGTMKRSASDTMLSSRENDFHRFTKFTGRLVQNLLSVGKSFKQRASAQKPSRVAVDTRELEPSPERSEVNEDSDSGLSRLQKFQHRLQTNLKRPSSKSQSPEPSQEEVQKQEMRTRSKSKIIIV